MTEIRVGRGYRTDIGAVVALEPAQHPDDEVEGLTLASLGIQRDASKPHGCYRLLQVLVEATVPVSLTDAHARSHAIAADIEDALDDWIPLPNALPVQVEDIVLLDRPEGLPMVAVQVALTIRYRR
ncbi:MULTISPECIES: hypothetical protein [unclassified Lysobacter]|uniref:hypothetical protein n=1 Tax=unclassified Lysobacter TaxID=2635362 RepID=UPI001BE9CEEC|nr:MULTISPECIES: hypothetical protein [unclassified Lysobacter]MBT2748577.1 hypothetical protein [Lysobacter sp. ISL-42]MBT2751512.1 hypothetical protein [Lysobacter sp. ISL-50]MBT2775706.1 hypothetical protein [Lysobacter sp. ISL-54]MBT2782329.1 hypothetical protein [Lysobacter sp. ISL-52]